MASGLQYIRKRIKSIKNTRQVTKAMEAVAASKMRKSVEKALKSREYAMLAAEMIENLTRQGVAAHHPLVKKYAGKKILVLLITSDRGLCGGFNAQIMKSMMEYAKKQDMEKIEFVCLGKKGQATLRRNGKNVMASFESIDHPDSQNIIPVSQFLTGEYLKGEYEKVMIAFTDFKSALKQTPTIRQLLPLSYAITEVAGPEKNETAEKSVWQETEYIFEPDREEVLNFLIPRLLETQVYQTLLESSAAEHSARMFAMRNATDNASDIINGLTLTYNQARQAGITQEIAEISAGKAALEK